MFGMNTDQILHNFSRMYKYPESKVHGTNMGPTWVLLAPDGPHVGPMNLALGVGDIVYICFFDMQYTIPADPQCQGRFH